MGIDWRCCHSWCSTLITLKKKKKRKAMLSVCVCGVLPYRVGQNTAVLKFNLDYLGNLLDATPEKLQLLIHKLNSSLDVSHP